MNTQLQDFSQQLNDFLELEELNDTGYQESSTFMIQNKDQANYAIRKVKEIRDQKNKIIEEAKQAIDNYAVKVEMFKQQSLSPLTFRETVLMNQLQIFAASQLQGSDKKSIKMIEGTIGFRKQQPLFEYDDEAIVAYMKQYPKLAERYTSVKITPNKAAIKKDGIIDLDNSFKIGDAVIPGIKTEQRGDAFDVK
jgi:hypothetical protein